MSRINRYDILLFSIVTIGAILSVYLLVETLTLKVPNYCEISSMVNCRAVEFSPYSRVFGIPDALLGALWFIGIGVLWILRFKDLITYLWIVGIAFVGYFIFTEIVLIKSICIYCTLVHLLAILLAIPIFINKCNVSR